MSIVPAITFKAGLCDFIPRGRYRSVRPIPNPGFIFLYAEDELMHFCWCPRNIPLDEAPLNLVMVPGDGHFVPYEGTEGEETSKTNGRIFVLRFESSSQRHLFWLQSKTQSPTGDLSWFSPRDRKIGEIVEQLLQGEEPDVAAELAALRSDDHQDGDDDETMEDVEGHGDAHPPRGGSTGGAGSGATGGDINEEGESAREGGADGARAAASGTDAEAVVRNLLASLAGSQGIPQGTASAGQPVEKSYPPLNDLLETSVTVPVIRSADEDYIDSLLHYLPPAVLVLSQQQASDDDNGDVVDTSADAVAAAKASMTLGEKKRLLEKVIRSPQFAQSLASLSTAIRDGGLPSISEALGTPVKNQGYLPGGAMPMGGGEALEAFVEGVKKSVKDKMDKQ